MNRKTALVLVASLALLLGGFGTSDAARRRATPRDRRAPTARIDTQPYGAFFSISHIREGVNAQASVLNGGQIEGNAADDSSGIKQVKVTFTPCQLLAYHVQNTCGAGTPPATLCAACTYTAVLVCQNAARQCGFNVWPPAYPGVYEVKAEATDKAGNRGRSAGIFILVV